MILETKVIGALKELNLDASLQGFIDQTLLGPLKEFLATPGKKIRGRLVELGWILSQPPGKALSYQEKEKCDQLAHAIEALHAGSLIIDDIQDCSTTRRGKAALHIQSGIPLALNAGNWLYFRPFEIIREMELKAVQELKLYRQFHQTFLQAHLGQALDLGIKMESVPQNQVRALCLATLELKTGALVALGLTSGAILADADSEKIEILENFGRNFGVGLQMFDDLGCKRMEDLRRKTPSWIWACAAELDEFGFQALCDVLKGTPRQDEIIEEWFLENGFLLGARKEASAFISKAVEDLKFSLGRSASDDSAILSLIAIQNEIEGSYDK